MKSSQVIYTHATNALQDLEQEIKLKLSFMLFFMEQGTRRLGVSLEETQLMVETLKESSSKIRQHLQDYEKQLDEHLQEAFFTDWIGEGSLYDQNTVH